MLLTNGGAAAILTGSVSRAKLVRTISGRYAAFTKRLVDSVLTTPGHTTTELRRAVLKRAAGLGAPAAVPPADSVPPPLRAYLDTVALHAYQVTDDDLAALKRAGQSDDTLFELTVAAAVGAALGRLERGLAALSSTRYPD